MTDADLTTRAAEAAKPYLPPFCTVVEGGECEVIDPKTLRRKSVLFARFSFPGATDTGFWREDLRDMATVSEADYETYQRLKEQWRGPCKST